MATTFVVATSCAGRGVGRPAPPDDGAYLVFRNNTEDEVRVFVYEGERRWLVGVVEAFHGARLLVPSDLVTNPGQIVVAAVPVGGRGLNGEPASGAIVLSDAARGRHNAIRLDTVGAYALCVAQVTPTPLTPHGHP